MTIASIRRFLWYEYVSRHYVIVASLPSSLPLPSPSSSPAPSPPSSSSSSSSASRRRDVFHDSIYDTTHETTARDGCLTGIAFTHSLNEHQTLVCALTLFHSYEMSHHFLVFNSHGHFTCTEHLRILTFVQFILCMLSLSSNVTAHSSWLTSSPAHSSQSSPIVNPDRESPSSHLYPRTLSLTRFPEYIRTRKHAYANSSTLAWQMGVIFFCSVLKNWAHSCATPSWSYPPMWPVIMGSCA